MKIKISFFVFSLLLFGLFINKVEANNSFSDIGAGATTDDGYTVTDPTIFELGASVTTRYLRVEIRNDGALGDEEYSELRSIKAWTDGSTNVLRGIHSGGNAEVVEIDGYNGASPYETDLLEDCSNSWYPQGSLCDEAPNANSKTTSSKSNEDSGATWSVDSANATGVLVIDMNSVQELTELRVFQMFSDGKTTQIRFAYHPETGSTPPDWNASGWINFPQENLDNEDEEEDNDDYADCKKQYGSDSYKQDYQKVKYYKNNEFDLYFQMQTIYRTYRVSGDTFKENLEMINPEVYQKYKEYRRYKKYKKCKELK